jgi:hypothetical protein
LREFENKVFTFDAKQQALIEDEIAAARKVVMMETFRSLKRIESNSKVAVNHVKIIADYTRELDRRDEDMLRVNFYSSVVKDWGVASYFERDRAGDQVTRSLQKVLRRW